ncbi:MAG: 2-nitropropane dioxygenase, partial [Nostoc sp.]
MIVGDKTINRHDQILRFDISNYNHQLLWEGNLNSIFYDQADIKSRLLSLHKPCYVVKVGDRIGITNEGYLSTINTPKSQQTKLLAFVPPISTKQLGNRSFLSCYGVKFAYATGA